MGHRYSHLELAERRQIATLMEAKVPIADIACQLGRHRSTIYRETRRNFYHTDFRDRWGQEYRGYYAVSGHRMAERRRARQAKLVHRPTLREHVVARLRDGWSPQQIAGRLKLDGHPAGRVSHETIYRHVYSRQGHDDALYRLLPMARRQRRPRFGRKPRTAVIPLERGIAARPAHIGERKEFGHWEGDLVIFARRSGGGNVTSLQERQTRFVMLIGNDDKRAGTVTKGIATALEVLPGHARRSITFDRGTI